MPVTIKGLIQDIGYNIFDIILNILAARMIIVWNWMWHLRFSLIFKDLYYYEKINDTKSIVKQYLMSTKYLYLHRVQ